jgi:hypothetical protein
MAEHGNFVQRYKENLGETRPWDLLNPKTNYVDEKSQEIRFDICKECPSFLKVTSQCKKCGCIMSLKTKLEKASCPIGKW